MIEKKTVLNPASAPITSRVKTTQQVNQNVGHTMGTPGFFHKENYIWMLAGLVVILIGMLVMSGGKSTDPNVFDQKEVYSTTRITIAPLLIVIGLGLEVFAIFKKPKR
jgi:hypothetical protein